MKKLMILFFLITSIGLNVTKAQVSVGVRVGYPPVWAPRAYNTRYYYIPELDAYYDASRGGYYVNDGSDAWSYAATLPGYYGAVDFNLFHPVAVNYWGARPWGYFGRYRLGYVRNYHPGWGSYGWYRPRGERFIGGRFEHDPYRGGGGFRGGRGYAGGGYRGGAGVRAGGGFHGGGNGGFHGGGNGGFHGGGNGGFHGGGNGGFHGGGGHEGGGGFHGGGGHGGGGGGHEGGGHGGRR